MRTLSSLGAALTLTLALTPAAQADEANRLTYMTFSAPVQVPGVTLAPGTYTFKIAETASNRHVVQIFNKDDNQLITTAMTIPSERIEPVDDTLVTFAERPAGSPQAVKAWFYPGRSIGEEFLYPKQPKLMARAEQAQQPPVNNERQPASTNAPQTDSGTTGGARRAASQAAPPPDVRRQPSTDAGPRAAEPAAPAPAASAAERSLPQTASPIAMVGLLTGFSLTAAYGVRRLRRRQ